MLKKKEIFTRLNTPVFGGLIIFVLAVLVAAGSWFYFVYRKKFGNITNEKGTSLSFIRVEFPEQKLPDDRSLSTEVWWNCGEGYEIEQLSEDDIGIEPYYGEFMENPLRKVDFNANFYKFWVILTNRKTYEKIESLGFYEVKKIKLASKEAFESDMVKKAQMSVLDSAAWGISSENWAGYKFRPNGICCFDRNKPEENYKTFLSRLKYQITQPNNAYSGPASSLREEDVGKLSSEGFFLINRFSPPKDLEEENDEILFWTRMSIDYNANDTLDDEYFISYAHLQKKCFGMGHYFEDPAGNLGNIDCDYLGAPDSYSFPK